MPADDELVLLGKGGIDVPGGTESITSGFRSEVPPWINDKGSPFTNVGQPYSSTVAFLSLTNDSVSSA